MKKPKTYFALRFVQHVSPTIDSTKSCKCLIPRREERSSNFKDNTEHQNSCTNQMKHVLKEKPEAILPTHREDRYMVNLLGNVQGTPRRAETKIYATVSENGLAQRKV